MKKSFFVRHAHLVETIKLQQTPNHPNIPNMNVRYDLRFQFGKSVTSRYSSKILKFYFYLFQTSIHHTEFRNKYAFANRLLSFEICHRLLIVTVFNNRL